MASAGFCLGRLLLAVNLSQVKVFVTGGAGYIGSICVEQLLNSGHDVVVFDNLSEGHRQAVDKRARFIEGCLSDRETIINSVVSNQSQIIMHFAANALVGESMINPSKYFRNNVAYGINLLDAAIEAKVQKFVFSSTCATYGIPNVIPMTEDLPLNPINPYGESKVIFEKLLQWYHKLHGLEFVALRYFNAAGASENFGEHHRIETHLIPNVLKVALGQSNQCKIFGTDYPTPDGTCIRDYIHVSDLAKAHVKALEYIANQGESINVNLGSESGASVLEMITAAEKITGRKINYSIVGRREGDPANLIATSALAKEKLNWQAEHSDINSLLKSTWEAYLQNGVVQA